MCNSYGQWTAVCDYEWTQYHSIVACKQLGYSNPSKCSFNTSPFIYYLFIVDIVVSVVQKVGIKLYVLLAICKYRIKLILLHHVFCKLHAHSNMCLHYLYSVNMNA